MAGLSAHSNEDEVYASFCANLIRFAADQRFSTSAALEILDVGCGNGKKLLASFSHLRNEARSIRLTLVDSDASWSSEIVKNATAEMGSVDRHVSIAVPCDAESFLVGYSKRIDFLFLIHFAYSSDAAELCRRLCERFLPSGTIAIISGESEESDLAQIRSQMARDFLVEMPKARVDEIFNWATLRNFSVLKTSLAGQFIDVSSGIHSGWLADLVFGRPMGDSADNRYLKGFDSRFRSVIESRVNSGRLVIPDDVLILWDGNSGALP